MLATILHSRRADRFTATGQTQDIVPFVPIGGRLRMHINHADNLRLFAIAGILAILTLAAFFGIVELVKQGAIPQIMGLFLA